MEDVEKLKEATTDIEDMEKMKEATTDNERTKNLLGTRPGRFFDFNGSEIHKPGLHTSNCDLPEGKTHQAGMGWR